MYVLLTLDSVEFPHHLRKPPCTKRRKNDHEQKRQRIRAKKCQISAFPAGIPLNGSKRLCSLKQPSVFRQDSPDYRADSKQHDNSLDKVIDRCRHVSAENNIESRQNRHHGNHHPVRNVEHQTKEA